MKICRVAMFEDGVDYVDGDGTVPEAFCKSCGKHKWIFNLQFCPEFSLDEDDFQLFQRKGFPTILKARFHILVRGEVREYFEKKEEDFEIVRLPIFLADTRGIISEEYGLLRAKASGILLPREGEEYLYCEDCSAVGAAWKMDKNDPSPISLESSDRNANAFQITSSHFFGSIAFSEKFLRELKDIANENFVVLHRGIKAL